MLDRLLEDDRIEIEGISGTSAGAMNAVILAHGYEINGRDGARKALRKFWKAISLKGAFSPYHSGIFNPLGADWSPLALWFDLLSQTLSPYQMNPTNFNTIIVQVTSWTLLNHLYVVGKQQADNWLTNHFDDIGLRSTLNLDEWTPKENAPASKYS